MTKPRQALAQKRIAAFLLALRMPASPRQRRKPEPVKQISDEEILARLKADEWFHKFCCKRAGEAKEWGVKVTVLELARAVYERE